MKSAIFLEDRKQNDLIRDLQRRVGSLEVRTGTTTGATTGPVTPSTPTTVVTMGGEVSGQSSDARVAKIIGKTVTTDAPIGGQYLEYNATEWYPRTGWIKASARAAVDSNVTIASPGSTLDGLTPTAGQTFLLFGQTDPIENGLYTWFGASEPMVRRYDCDSGGNFVRGFVVTVVEGSYQSQLFVCTAADDIDVGTDTVTFNQVRGVTRVRVNSTGSTYERPRLNFIPGTNATIAGADDPTDKEIDLTFGSFLVVREVGGTPSIDGTILEFPNGTLTNPSGTIARYTPATPTITVRDIDGTPSIAATTIEFTNGTVTDQTGGVARVTIANSGITVTEQDGAPSVSATEVRFPNGTLTDNGSGVVSVAFPPFNYYPFGVPASPNADDQEFQSGSAPGTDFNIGSVTVSRGDYGLKFVCPSNSSAQNVRGRVFSRTLADGDFVHTYCAVEISTISPGFCDSGIALVENTAVPTTTDLYTCTLGAFGQIYRQNYSDQSTQSGGALGTVSFDTWTRSAWIGWSRSGTTYTCWASRDGRVWLPINAQTITSAPNGVLLFCNPFSQAADVYFRNLRYRTGVGPTGVFQ